MGNVTELDRLYPILSCSHQLVSERDRLLKIRLPSRLICTPLTRYRIGEGLMHKHLLICAVLGAASLLGATTYANAQETRAQHREWIRKFGDPGGSLNGSISTQDTKVYRIDLLSCQSGRNEDQSEKHQTC
jgi:hypothetical protein